MMSMKILFLFALTRICNCMFCNDGSNPCDLDKPEAHDSYFLPVNGYYCLDATNGQVICTCPDNSTTRDHPCRICKREPNPCGVGPSFVSCTEINRSFSCLCNDGSGELIFSSKPCDRAVVTTSTITPPTDDSCENEGVKDPITNVCNCPSGYTDERCQTRADAKLCDKIFCKYNGACAIRPLLSGGSVYQSKCLCRSGTDGEYCERQSSTKVCTSGHCLNSGVCEQRDIGSTRFAYCQCKKGWTGPRCETQYFRCQTSGYFIDELMKDQGKYFWCIPYNNDFLIKQMSCPKGLKYNFDKKLCLY